MLWSQSDVLEDEIRDLQRILNADEALLEKERSDEKRLFLVKEIGGLQYKIDQLRERINSIERID